MCVLMCAPVTVGMSVPLITRLFGPPSNVQTSYYNLVNAPLAVAMGLLIDHTRPRAPLPLDDRP